MVAEEGLRQEDYSEFKANLDHSVSPNLKKEGGEKRTEILGNHMPCVYPNWSYYFLAYEE